MKSITINTSIEDANAIEQVAGFVPLATRHAIARAALRLGLTQMVADKGVATEQLVAQHEAGRAARGGTAAP